MITVSTLVQILIFVFSLSLYVALVSKILPLILLKARYNVKGMGDRGLRKYIYEGGRSIVYKPCGKTGKYIHQYILSSDDEDKCITCKFDNRIRSIKFDVIALDVRDKAIDTVQISVPLVSISGVTKAILPERTAYVCIVVKEVNGYVVPDTPKMYYPFLRVISFVGVTTVLTAMEYAVLRISAISALQSVFPLVNGMVAFLPSTHMLNSAFAGFVLALIILVLHRQKDVKIFK